MLSFAQLDIVSPKQTRSAQNGWDTFFPYYAGYPSSFAGTLLRSSGLKPDAVVLDPWNGSGTTTLAAADLGFRAVGCDINPVMLVVSRARCLSPSDGDSIEPLARLIANEARQNRCIISDDDPLLGWFDTPTTETIRCVEGCIRERLLGSWTLRTDGTHFECMSSIAATFYVALFLTCRSFVAAYQSSNPTWLKRPKGDEDPISVKRTQAIAVFRRRLKEMASQLRTTKDLGEAAPRERYEIELSLSDSTKLSLPSSSVDFVLTSPPYCTRIDYTAATRIELAVLAPLLKTAPEVLARTMMGSIRVPLNKISMEKYWGKTCNNFLRDVEKHPSKASSGYYLKTHLDYFSKLWMSLDRIKMSLKKEAPVVMVVQGSYYKEIYNDLPKIVSEMAAENSFRVLGSKEFRLARSMAGINPYTRIYGRKSEAIETVVCFAKT